MTDQVPAVLTFAVVACPVVAGIFAAVLVVSAAALNRKRNERDDRDR